LSRHHVLVDYRNKTMIFRLDDEEEFVFYRDGSVYLPNIFSTITGKMVQKGVQGFWLMCRI
jgi:hypothetical protein